MKAMVMAAGVGSRLMPMTREIPKPMVPVGNRPLMENIIQLLKKHEVKEVVANLHYNAEVITEFFGDGSKFGMDMHYSFEKKLLGTAGGVRRCSKFLDDTFIIVSGDALTDIDLNNLMMEHKSKGALATIALKEVEEVEQFGVVIIDEMGKIKDFQEKPLREHARSNLANTGIYIFEPEIFDYIPRNTFYDFGKQVFPHLVQINAPFYGVNIADYWCDVGSLSTYHTANNDALDGKLNFDLSGRLLSTKDGGRVLIGDRAEIGHDVVFLGNVVIGHGCRIKNNASISNCIIWDGTVVDENVKLDRNIIGSKCHITWGISLNPGAVVPSLSIIKPDFRSEVG